MILALLIVLIFAGTVAASLFYFQKNNQTPTKTVSANTRPKITTKFPVTGEKIKILFLGDLMFDRWIRQVSETKGDDFVFQKVGDLLKGEDLVVGNLEGPITDKASVSVASEFGAHDNYIFTFPPKTAQDLFAENIKLVSLGNNHILNQGKAGLASTENYLQAANVGFFGDPAQTASIKYYAASGLKIAFVNYNQFVADGKNKTLADIRSAKAQGADITILYAHWGAEFVGAPDQKIKQLAHQFVDAGADLVIGSHPHVIQPKETYQGKAIYYSLGNFLFDQYFQPETQKGLGVEVTLDPATKNMDFNEYNFSLLKNGQTVIN